VNTGFRMLKKWVRCWCKVIILHDKKKKATRGSVCAIGSFDGVHRGHQAVVARVKMHARSGKKTGIITFAPLPFFVLSGSPEIYLSVKREKEHYFRSLGVDFIYYFRFDKHFAGLSSQDFVSIIAERIGPSTVVVGDNFHFGHGRKGSAMMLREIAGGRFSVDIMERVKDHGTISSTRIRELILLGHMDAANKLLGRLYSITGVVVRGQGKGAELGFPTINIHAPADKLMPLEGVYKAQVAIKERIFKGAMFCREDLIEVHILDFHGDLYRKKVRVDVGRRIRGIEHFTDKKALCAAIARDIEQARR
jgi:riboflavin kinase/FMN adenylyltransferase